MRNTKHTDTIVKTDGIGHHIRREPAPTYRTNQPESAVILEAGEKLVLDGLRTYTIGSAVSYALETGDDPVASVDRCRELGHKLVWIYGNGASLTAWKREPEPHIQVTIGMLVKFQGNFYTIEKAPNQNLDLKPYVAAAVEVA